MNVPDELLDLDELANFIRERVPLHMNFGDKSVSYSWNPQFVAEELVQWFRGEIIVHGQKAFVHQQQARET